MRAEPSPALPPQADRRPAFSSPAPATTPQQEILLVEAEAAAAEHAAVLRREYRVLATTDINVAIQYLHKAAPALVVGDIDSLGNAAVDLCRAARSARIPTTVLMTTSNEASVPDVLHAGCDAVLLKRIQVGLLASKNPSKDIKAYCRRVWGIE